MLLLELELVERFLSAGKEIAWEVEETPDSHCRITGREPGEVRRWRVEIGALQWQGWFAHTESPLVPATWCRRHPNGGFVSLTHNGSRFLNHLRWQARQSLWGRPLKLSK